MQTAQFQARVTAIVAACQGKGLAFNMLKDAALTDPAEFDNLIEAGRVEFATMYGIDPAGKKATLSAMQTAKVPGVSTFYTYASCMAKMLRQGKMSELADLKAASLTAKRSKTGGEKKDETKASEAAKGLDVDAVIAQLVAMHKANALTAAQIEALASIRPAVKATPMVQRVEGLALAA